MYIQIKVLDSDLDDSYEVHSIRVTCASLS